MIWHLGTSRRRAELLAQDMTMELRERVAANHELASIVQQSGDAIITINMEFRCTSWNDAATRLLGYTGAEAVGVHISSLHLSGYSESELAATEKRLASNETYVRESVVWTKSGQARDVLTTSSPQYGPDGERRGRIVGLRDIKELKDARSKLAAQLSFTQDLLEAIPHPVYFKDYKGRYLGLNLSFARLFGIDRTAWIGKTVFETLPQRADYYHEMDLQLLRAGGTQCFESQVEYRPEIGRAHV